MDAREFVPYGPSHWVALAATAVAAIGMIRLNRSVKVAEPVKQRANTILAILLVVAVSLDPLLTWLRYRHDPDVALAGTLVRETALPLYLCDVVSLVLAVALVTRRQRWTEMGYFWGLAGTVQGLLTPTLYFNWDTPEYYAFFVQHGGVPVAALALVFGAGIKPQRGAFRRAVLWSWVYMAVVFCLNVLLDSNYGFLNHKPAVGTLFDYMGPEPWYLLTLQAVAFSLYGLLLLPFARRSESPIVADPAL
ncbi:TIGR02206 family membrane protein [Luteolibacter ambystomatis]|uniref:TIGR02206 family membrane protein n=1 Tax=Luteolibacter ambystomatis TaxID=2824561 RepID=A0A975PG34_9BACT|nr:TIGR02206 family membrane protein [Luteolibacter ambystomatis]QUE51956.1 TIGR02206 family membrane protein [Luteolibacter ambystomatis]